MDNAMSIDDIYIEELLREAYSAEPPPGMWERILKRASAEASASRPSLGLAWLRELARLAARPRRRVAAALATAVVLASVCIVASVVRADPQVLLDRGRELYKAGDYAAAIETLKEVPSDSPVSYEALATLGECYWKKHDYRKAAEYFLRAAESPRTAFANDQIANAVECLCLQGKTSEARRLLERRVNALKGDPTERIMKDRLAVLHRKTGDPDRAIQILKEIIDEKPPGLHGYWYGLALCYEAKGDYEQAIVHFKEAAKSEDRTLAQEATFKTADCLRSSGRRSEAVAVLRDRIEMAKAAGDKRSLQDTLRRLAVMHRDNGDFDAATGVFDELIRSNPENVAGCYYTLATCYQSKGHYERAIEWFEKAAATTENHDLAQEARVMVVLSLRKQGKAAEARAYAQKIYNEERPNLRPRLLLLQGDFVYWDGNDPEGAIAPLQKLVSEFPDHPLAVRGRELLVWALQKAGRSYEVTELVRDLVAREDSPLRRAGWLDRLGSLYHKAGRYSEAANAYRELLEIGDITVEQRAKATYDLALCYRARGHSRIAENYMWRVVKRYPHSQCVQSARGQLYLWGALPAGGDVEAPEESAK